MHYPHNIKPDYGFFHAYAFFMIMGIVAVFLLSSWQIHRRKIKINWTWFLVGMGVTAITGLLGASFIGKTIGYGSIAWYKRFAFWSRNGGMAIYGAILFGLPTFVVYFSIFCYRSKVSFLALADAVVVNGLIAQAIGRWGNFFNHEILGGAIVPRSSLNWLPDWIADNCRYKDNFGPGIVPQYHAPLFLYESIGTLIAWFLLTFVVSRISEFIGPRKPDFSKLPPALRNQKRSLWEPGFKFWSRPSWFSSRISCRQLWLRDYYGYQPNLTTFRTAKLKDHNRIYNPHQFLVVRSGVVTGLYFIFWNLIRIAMTPLRSPSDFYTLTGKYTDWQIGTGTGSQIGVEISFMLVILVAALVLICLTQAGYFLRFRRLGTTYEKPYLDLTKPVNWQLDRYISLYVKNGLGNKVSTFSRTIAAFVSWTLGTRINEQDLKSYFKIEKFNLFAQESQALTLRAILVLKPTSEIIKKWSISSPESFSWRWDERLNLKLFKLVLQKFIKQYGLGAGRVIQINKLVAYHKILNQQLARRFCYNDPNLFPFTAGLSFLDQLSKTNHKAVIKSAALQKNALFYLNSNLKLAV